MEYFLILVIFLLALGGYLKDLLPERIKRLLVPIFIILLLASTLMQVYLVNFKEKKEWLTKWSGRLHSPIKSTEKYAVLVIGLSKIVSTVDPPDKPRTIIDMAGEPLSLRLIEGEARLSVVIRDSNGIVLAAIKDNEWFVAPSKALDRNFNENTLEVVDSKGDIVFQVEIYGEEVRLA